MKKGHAAKPWPSNTIWEEEYTMKADKAIAFRESTLVLYDLRDAEAWTRAHMERAAWGREQTEIHTVGPDHVVIEFKAGGALEASA